MRRLKSAEPLAVDLSRPGSEKAVENMDGPRHRRLRQFSCDFGLNTRGLGGPGDVGGQPCAPVGHGDRSLVNTVAFHQRRLDLTRMDAMSVDLDFVVGTSCESQGIADLLDHVAGSVPRRTVPFDEAVCFDFTHVSGGQSRAADEQFSTGADGGVHSRQRTAQLDGFSPDQWSGQADHGCFGGAVGIQQADVAPDTFMPLRDTCVIGRFATDDDGADRRRQANESVVQGQGHLVQ